MAPIFDREVILWESNGSRSWLKDLRLVEYYDSRKSDKRDSRIQRFGLTPIVLL